MICVDCGLRDTGVEDDFGDPICPECASNHAERAWERFQSRFYGAGEPVTLNEQHAAAYAEHRRCHR